MAEYVLYGQHWSEPDSGVWILICQGIYHHQASRGNSIYPTLRYLGSIDITGRRFVKGAKHPRKIVRQNGDDVYLFNYHGEDGPFTILTTLFTNLGYDNTLLQEIQNIVLTTSNNPRIKTNDRHRIGGENDGIAYF